MPRGAELARIRFGFPPQDLRDGLVFNLGLEWRRLRESRRCLILIRVAVVVGAAGQLVERRGHGRRQKVMAGSTQHPRAPNGRYFVIRGRPWRASNPGLEQGERERPVRMLMAARRAVHDAAGEPAATVIARVGRRQSASPRWRLATAALSGGMMVPPEYNRRIARTTPNAAWFSVRARDATLTDRERYHVAESADYHSESVCCVSQGSCESR